MQRFIELKPILLFLLSAVIVIELYFAEHSRIKRPEIFYGLAALMLFAALMIVSGLG
jgi:hypothetical protein